jgi:hypothetical protein
MVCATAGLMKFLSYPANQDSKSEIAAAVSDVSVLVVLSSVLEADNCELILLGMRYSCCRCRANTERGSCRVVNDAIINGQTANTSISMVLIIIMVRSTTACLVVTHLRLLSVSVVNQFLVAEVKVKDVRALRQRRAETRF